MPYEIAPRTMPSNQETGLDPHVLPLAFLNGNVPNFYTKLIIWC